MLLLINHLRGRNRAKNFAIRPTSAGLQVGTDRVRRGPTEQLLY
jgi:hypothetical protein